jgi:uncharacterized protein YcfL
MRRFVTASSCVLTLALALTGCHKPPHAGQADSVLRENYPRISVENSDLADHLVFSPANVQSGPEQPLSVVVPVRLESFSEASVQYRFEFYTRDGRPMRNPMVWRYIKLAPRTQFSLEGAALDTNATDWRLIVRPARSDL